MRYPRDVTAYSIRYFDKNNDTIYVQEIEHYGQKNEKSFSKLFSKNNPDLVVLECKIIRKTRDIFEIDDDILFENSKLVEKGE